MTDTTLANEMGTDPAGETANQAQSAKTYSQQEVDNMMARMRGSLEKKLLKPYEDLGDPEQLRTIKSEWEKKQEEQQVKKGEFERILQEKADKWNAEISKRDSIIKDYKVNMPLLSAAAKFNAVNAEQVKALLANQVRLNNDGEVEVVDDKGSVRYNDRGEAVGVDDLVRGFLDLNPHFRTANPSTTNTKSMVSGGTQPKLDISKLDMTKPEHRKIYADYRKTNGIA
jgi:hypothetical protein